MRLKSLTARAALALALALATVVAPVPVAADAAAPVETAVVTDTWLGGLAAVGCGIFVRASILTGGTQVGIIVGAVACCAYAILDLVFIDPN